MTDTATTPGANKEAVYDELIHPLMGQIMTICKEHQIAMVASFALPTDGDPGLRCTSCNLLENTNAPHDYALALSVLMANTEDV